MENAEKYPIDEAFLVRYFVNDTTESENRLVQDWLLQNPENSKVFAEVQKLWVKTGALRRQTSVDVDSAWQKMQAKMKKMPLESSQTAKLIPIQARKKTNSWSGLRVAASVVLVLGLGWLIYNLSKPSGSLSATVAFKTENKAQNLVLNDGTKIFLNKKSKINYPKNFDKKARVVEFSGEAYFEVKSNPQQPFQIKTEHLAVEVLGTAFNLQTETPQGETILIVQEGRVRVSTEQASEEYTAGEKAIYNPQTKTLQKVKNNNQNYLAYKTLELNFDQTPLREVVRQINELYETKIELANPNLANCLLTVKFVNQDLDMLLQIIAETLALKIEKKNGIILLDGERCE
ncbi:MAG: FecR domain-containing protein [Microscillaceae bacterium]|nr:FecR domain-containing protein [Microscillaceae bacterium]